MRPRTSFSFAEKGQGAWLNEARLRVSGRSKMLDCVFATGVPFAAKKTLPAMLHDLSGLMPQCAGLRRWGAAALDLAYVAAGRFDGYWERELGPWDVAAGLILVREAGGFVEPLHPGNEIFENGGADRLQHGDLRTLLQGDPVAPGLISGPVVPFVARWLVPGAEGGPEGWAVCPACPAVFGQDCSSLSTSAPQVRLSSAQSASRDHGRPSARIMAR